jgi:hypothetical protein
MCGPMDTLLQLRVDLFASCKELTQTNDYSRNKLLGNISSYTSNDASEKAAMQADVCEELPCLNEREKTN